MRKTILAVTFVLVAFPVFAQSVAQREAEIRATVPYSDMARQVAGVTIYDCNAAVRRLAERDAASPSSQPAYTVPRYTPPTYTAPKLPNYTPPTTGSTFDWRSGNSYRWGKEPDGTTKVRGSNLNTGSTWNTTIRPDGSMRGTDSDMNPWSYNERTKTYINYGTGKMCVGEGYAGVCTD